MIYYFNKFNSQEFIVKYKNKYVFFTLFLISFISFTYAQTEQLNIKRVLPDSLFLSHLEKPKDYFSINKKTINSNTKYFYVINFREKKYDAVLGVLKYTNEIVKIWVDTLAILNNFVTQKEINDLVNYLEKYTYEKSKSSNTGIIPLVYKYFGMPPNVDEYRNKGQGDGKLNILITDIQDNFSESGVYIPGFFNYEDVDKNGYISNKMDLIYIDCNPGIFYKGVRSIDRALPSIPHELQHLIHWNYDPNECTFINESMSILAEIFCGFRVDLPEDYFSNPNISLFDWNDEFEKNNTSRAALFGEYLREQCGDDYIKFLIANPYNKNIGIDSSLKKAGINNWNFELLVTNWAIANYVNDKYLNTKFGYHYKLLQKPIVEKTHRDPNVLNNYVSVNHLAPIYIKYTMGESLNAVFKFNPNVVVKAIEKGNSRFNIYDVSANYNYVQNNYGIFYNEIVFVCLNFNKFGDDPQYVSYSSSGKMMESYKEISYDDGEPESYGLSTEVGVKRFVKFRMPAGKQLDSVKLAFKTKGKGLFHIYKATDTSVYAVDNIILPIMFTVTDTFPKWTKIDLTRYRIVPEYDLAIGYEILPGDAPNPLLWGDITDVKERSIAYFPSTGLWYSINTNYLIRAYVSNFTLSVKKINDIIPENFILYQNYPNPFNNSTTIKFELKTRSKIKLKIFDLLGKEVISLIDEELLPGVYTVQWNGKNKYAVNVPSGLYIYCLENNDKLFFKKMIYLK